MSNFTLNLTAQNITTSLTHFGLGAVAGNAIEMFLPYRVEEDDTGLIVNLILQAALNTAVILVAAQVVRPQDSLTGGMLFNFPFFLSQRTFSSRLMKLGDMMRKRFNVMHLPETQTD